MWEAIEANKRRTLVILLLMGATLAGLGVAIGAAVDPLEGPYLGPLVAGVIWIGISLVAWFQGDSIVLATAGAREIQKADAPQLWNIVEEMTIAAALPKMPRVYLIYDDAPNAFAAGRDPDKAAIAVTTGLLQRLDRDELQGVIAHEIGHIRNYDIRYMTLAAVTLGAIVIISDFFLHSMRFGMMGRGRRDNDRNGDQIQIIAVVVSLVFAILAPLLARLLYFACSRRREFLADASAARFTRYPEGLARALEKIALKPEPARLNRALAPLYIVNPMQAFGASGLFSTHPSTEARVKILRSMGGAADLADYEKAYHQVTGRTGAMMSPALLAELSGERVPARAASPEAAAPADTLGRASEALDVINRLDGYVSVACACGMRIKIPPGFKTGTVRCPRCGREHEIPKAATSLFAPPGPRGDAAPPGPESGAAFGGESARAPAGGPVGAARAGPLRPDSGENRRGNRARCAPE